MCTWPDVVAVHARSFGTEVPQDDAGVEIPDDRTSRILRRILVPSLPDNGMVHLSSPYPFAETIKRLESLLKAQGLTMFCRIDHSGAAEKGGLKMLPTQVVVFGSPEGGTPLMNASPTLAIDLPLKALIWEDGGDKVWISYNTPEYLKQRHDIPDELLKNIAGIGPLLQKVVG
jgi:uncharacterized protein (DUF302 family)